MGWPTLNYHSFSATMDWGPLKLWATVSPLPPKCFCQVHGYSNEKTRATPVLSRLLGISTAHVLQSQLGHLRATLPAAIPAQLIEPVDQAILWRAHSEKGAFLHWNIHFPSASIGDRGPRTLHNNATTLPSPRGWQWFQEGPASEPQQMRLCNLFWNCSHVSTCSALTWPSVAMSNSILFMTSLRDQSGQAWLLCSEATSPSAQPELTPWSPPLHRWSLLPLPSPSPLP